MRNLIIIIALIVVGLLALVATAAPASAQQGPPGCAPPEGPPGGPPTEPGCGDSVPPISDPGCNPECFQSNRNIKNNFAEVDARDILARLSAIPIETWNYKSQEPSVRHIGPMAQDFYAAFGVGEDDRHINTVDASGVSLAAIQGLYQIVQQKDAQIAKLEARLEVLEQASSANGSPAEASLFGGLTIWLALGGLVLVTPGLVLGYRRIRR